MSGTTPRTTRPSSENLKKTRKTQAFSSENELVGARGGTKPRIAPSVIDHGFHTDKYKTYYSAWTPVLNSASNSKIFVERLDLIGHWFSMWTDAQRKKFLTFILKRCTKSQLRFVNEGWFKKQLPILHLDFTTVLPQFISTYIFSFLDPRSLCRAAQVSWHWKFVCEQDVIWMPKCLRYGWYLPYTPSSREFGCWKHHYIMCTSSLDMEAPSRMAENYGQFADNSLRVTQGKIKQKANEKRKIREAKYYREETRRPPWLDTDPQPRDLENSRKAMLYEHNPNQPYSPNQLRTERLGLSTRPLHRRSATAPAHMAIEKVMKISETVDVNGNVIEEGKEPVPSSKLTLTEALAAESGVDQTWPQPVPSSPVRRQDLTCGIHPSLHDSMLIKRSSQDLSSSVNPAVIFISSEIPASELLLEAVKFGVIAIPYEYEGTTLDALMEKLRLALQGRQANCIGLFAWGDCGTIRLVKGKILSEETVNEPNMRHFWETVTTSVMARESGGHMDIFIPLVETEKGMDLLVQLGLLTDMQFSCPTGMTGSFARGVAVESEWLFVPNSGSPPSLYFNATKFGSWSNTVDYIEECVDVVKKNLDCFFTEEQRDLAKRLVGQVTFEALGMYELHNVSEIATVLVDAVASLGRNNASKNWSDPVQGLIDYLQKHGHKDKKFKKVRKTTAQQDDFASVVETVDADSEDELNTSHLALQSEARTGTSVGEERAQVAHEILSTEVEYMRCLSIIQDVFKKPLQASLASNRAIISSANIQSLFADSETLLALSSLLVNDLSSRLDEWNSHQILGDIFLKFTNQLRAYTNFLNNYPVTLQTLERCREQNPQFRSFLGRHEKQPSTKMMSLPEFLFLPGRRVKSYVELLEAFLKYTPPDHVDRKTLPQAIEKFKDLDCLFREYKNRLEREKFLQELQKRIVNCPVLAEKGRHFIREENVILLSTPSTGKEVKPEFRIYQQVGDLGFFLFNDALVITTLTYKFVPFQRLVQRNYKFQACLTLKKLKVENLADSKYIKNAFTIVSPKRLWFCQSHSWDQKFQWISVLESAITSALEKC